MKQSRSCKIRFSKSLRPVKLKGNKRNEASQTMLAPDGTELQRSYFARNNMTKPLTCGASDASFTKYSTPFQNSNLRKINRTLIEFCFREPRLFRSPPGARAEKKQTKSMWKIKWPLLSVNWAHNLNKVSPSYLKIRLWSTLTSFKRGSSQKRLARNLKFKIMIFYAQF